MESTKYIITRGSSFQSRNTQKRKRVTRRPLHECGRHAHPQLSRAFRGTFRVGTAKRYSSLTTARSGSRPNMTTPMIMNTTPTLRSTTLLADAA